MVAERRLADIRLAYFSSKQALNKDIVIIKITESTLAKFRYRSPIDRSFLSELLELIQDKGARAIGIDILFDQPMEDAEDQKLARVIANLHVPVAVGYLQQKDGLTENQQAYLDRFVPVNDRGLINLNQVDFSDGTVRMMYAKKTGPTGVTQFSLAGLIADKLGIDASSSLMPIAWSHHVRPFQEIRAEDVRSLDPTDLKDKIAIVGVDSPWEDQKRTPLSSITGGGTVPGVICHAQALATLMKAIPIPTWSAWTMVACIIFAVTFAAFIAFYFYNLKHQRVLVIWAIVTIYWVIGFMTWFGLNIMLPLVIPTLVFFFLTLVFEIGKHLVRDR